MKSKITCLVTTRWLYALYGISLFLASIGQINAQSTCTPVINIEAGGSLTVCTDDPPFMLNITGIDGDPGFYFWNGGSGLSNPQPKSALFTPANASASSDGLNNSVQYNVFPDGTCSNSAQTSITIVVSEPADAGSNGTDEVCADGTTAKNLFNALNGSPSTGGTWSTVEGVTPGGFLGELSAENITTLGEGTHTFTYTVSSNAPCEDGEAEVALTITLGPTADAGDNLPFCTSQTNILIEDASAENQGAITWSSSGDGSFDDNSVETPTYTPGAGDIANGVVTLTMSVDGTGDCSGANAEDEVLIIISSAEPTANAGSDEATCEGEDFDLSNSSTPATSSNGDIAWSGGTGSFTSGDTNTPTYTPGDGETGEVTLTMTVTGNVGGCSGAEVTSTMTLTIHPTPTGTISANPDEVCDTDTFDLIFTATTGTGPFDIVVEGVTYNNVTSGGTFAAAQTITGIYGLTSIVDLGVTPNCTNSGISGVSVQVTGDLTAPTGTCPLGLNDLTCKSEIPDEATVRAAVQAAYTDNCGTVNVSLDSDSGDPTNSCNFSRTYTYQIDDGNGNFVSSNCTVTYSGNDDVAPVAPDDASANSTVACISAAITPTTPSNVTDNCGDDIAPTGPTIEDSPATLTCEGTRKYV